MKSIFRSYENKSPLMYFLSNFYYLFYPFMLKSNQFEGSPIGPKSLNIKIVLQTLKLDLANDSFDAIIKPGYTFSRD